MKSKILSAKNAVELIENNSTLCIGGAGAGHAVPDFTLKALGERFKQTGFPKNLTVIHPCGIGDNGERGLNHIAQEGLIKTAIGGFWGNAPKLATLAKEEKITGYNLPQGVLAHLMRAIAGGEPGLITKTGLHSFVDPRLEGGKINKSTKENLVKVVNIGNQELLYVNAIPVNVAIIRGSAIDEDGNLTMEEEVGTFSMLSMAQAAKANNGIVIAQVKKINYGKNAAPSTVKVPGILIDFVVVDLEQPMTFITKFEKALVDRTAVYEKEQLKLEGIKKVIARRAALELKKNDIVNLGYGMPDGVPIVAQQANQLDKITFMIEQGQIDGVITTGLNFGAMYNPTAIIDDAYQFDQFHGGILDICFLGFAQIDQHGNVNSSRFGNILTGCGGFIDISQNTNKVVFCGAFTAKSKIDITENGLDILEPGKYKKMLRSVEQITFSGNYSRQKNQKVLYITERAVFELTDDGVMLIEIAPGANLERDILEFMEFRPLISNNLKEISAEIYKENFQLKITE